MREGRNNIAIDCTILTEKQIYGNKRLDLFDQIGTKAALMDYSILLGAYVDHDFYVGEEKLENQAGLCAFLFCYFPLSLKFL